MSDILATASPLGFGEISIVEYLPFINACLNSLSTAFIIMGFVFIKKGDGEKHKKAMISAVITSAVFLISYLTYHFLQDVLTTYNGEGISRVLYYSLLISHTTLAVTVPPLVFLAIRAAIKNELQKHKKIVKYAFPIWLYVSFTGVLVYIILYHFN